MSDSSQEGAEIEVWGFRRFDARSGQYVSSIGKATVGAIEGFGAEAILGSMERIPINWLDVNGLYRPPTFVMSPVARRRLERLRAQYQGLIEDEDHARLEGWLGRVETLSMVVAQMDEQLAPPPSRQGG